MHDSFRINSGCLGYWAFRSFAGASGSGRRGEGQASSLILRAEIGRLPDPLLTLSGCASSQRAYARVS